MVFSKFIFLSLCIINFNVFSMEEITVLAEGTNPKKAYPLEVVLTNIDLKHETKTFRCKDSRKDNYIKRMIDENSHNAHIKMFGNMQKKFSCSYQQCENAKFYLIEGLALHAWRNHHYCLMCNVHFNSEDVFEEHCHLSHPFFCYLCYFYFNSSEELASHNGLQHQASYVLEISSKDS